MSYKDTIHFELYPVHGKKELSAPDTNTVGKENLIYKTTPGGTSPADKIGADFPYIKINSVPISELEYLSIDETGYIPKIKAIFSDDTGALSGPNYPKKDPVLSLYIKSGNAKLKAIGTDWLITNIKTSLDEVANSATIDSASTFIVTGELYIPKIYDNISKAYPNMTSKMALRNVAKELGLGFAVNHSNPSDSMTWINTNTNSLEFIKHISSHAYENEESFFNTFIDRNYFLTYVNVSEQIAKGHENNLTHDTTTDSSEYTKSNIMAAGSSGKQDDALSLMALTNKDEKRGKPEYMIKYSLSGVNGQILKNKGYRKKIYYYDHTLFSSLFQPSDDKFISFYMSPIKARGADSDFALIPEDDAFKSNMVKKWMNIDYGNNHREYNAAALINNHNISELNKIILNVETAGINSQIIRGSAVPVQIYHPSAKKIDRDSFLKDQNRERIIKEGEIEKDEILSGRYYVNGVKYIYDLLNREYPYKTQFQLGRVDWLGENNI